MNVPIKLCLTASLLLAFLAPTPCLKLAMSAEDVSQGGKTEPIAVPAEEASQKAVAKGKKAAVKHKKKRRKKGAKKRAVTAVESSTAGKLTVAEVMELIKTTHDLSGKNLSGLKLVGINMSKCNLKGVDLRNADLQRADLEEANLERTDFAGANLRMANLRMSGMTGANLENTNLDGAIWKDGRVCASGSIGYCRE